MVDAISCILHFISSSYCSSQDPLFFFFNFLKHFYLFLRERKRQSTSRGVAEREGDTESEAGSRLLAVSTEPDAGLEPMNQEIMT